LVSSSLLKVSPKNLSSLVWTHLDCLQTEQLDVMRKNVAPVKAVCWAGPEGFAP
jgi:hypothetical protein